MTGVYKRETEIKKKKNPLVGVDGDNALVVEQGGKVKPDLSLPGDCTSFSQHLANSLGIFTLERNGNNSGLIKRQYKAQLSNLV